MKKFPLFTLAVLLLVAFAAAAYGSGSFWGTRQGTLVQNLKEISPAPSSSRCDDVAGTKGVFKTYSTAGWYAAEMDAVDNTGAQVKGTWYLNGKRVAIGTGPFKVGNRNGADHATLAFAPYSAPPRTLSLCIRRQ